MRIQNMMLKQDRYLENLTDLVVVTWNICIRSSETKWFLKLGKIKLSIIIVISHFITVT